MMKNLVISHFVVLRIGLDHDGGGSAVSSRKLDPLEELLRDERHQRVGQLQPGQDSQVENLQRHQKIWPGHIL